MTPKSAGRWIAATLATDVILLVAAAVVVGVPDPTTAWAFLTGSRPSHSEAIAAVELTVWILLTIVVTMDLAYGLRSARAIARRFRGRRLHARLVLASGLLLFAGGLLHQQVDAPDVCCGSLTQAEKLLP